MPVYMKVLANQAGLSIFVVGGPGPRMRSARGGYMKLCPKVWHHKIFNFRYLDIYDEDGS